MTVREWVHRINRATTIPPLLIAIVVGCFAVAVIAAIAVPPLSRLGFEVPGTVLLAASILVGSALGYGMWRGSGSRAR